MRIIAGRHKGRTLKTPTWEGLRPTSDRLRETLFNVLAPRIQGARVLDVFAGTGAVALEALSRGAALAVCVESDRRATALIVENRTRTGEEARCRIVGVRAERALAVPIDGRPVEENEWEGWVPYDLHPSLTNPPEGYIATANNKVVDDSYPFYITDLWEPPYRVMRIREMIAAKEKHSLEDMARMQSDVVAIQAGAQMGGTLEDGLEVGFGGSDHGGTGGKDSGRVEPPKSHDFGYGDCGSAEVSRLRLLRIETAPGIRGHA